MGTWVIGLQSVPAASTTGIRLESSIEVRRRENREEDEDKEGERGSTARKKEEGGGRRRLEEV